MRSRTPAFVIAGVSIIVAIASLSGTICRVIALERTNAWLGSVPGLSVVGVSLNNDTLLLDGIDYRTAEGARIRVGRMAVLEAGPEPFDLVATASAAPASIVATDISISIKHNLISIPRIEALGTYLTADRLKALFDPLTDLFLAGRFKDLTAASVTAPTVSVTNMGGDSAKVIFDQVAMTDVVAGRIGAASIRDTTLFDTASTPAKTVATLGAVSLVGLDLPLALRIAQTSRIGRDEAPQPIYKSLSAHDILIAPDATATMKIASISADGFRGRPLLQSPAAVAALVKKPIVARTPDDVQALVDVTVDGAKGFSFDHLEWDGVSLSTTDQETALLRLGRMVIDGLSPTRAEAFVIDDLDLRTKDATLKMARMSLKTPDESGDVEVLARGLATSGWAMDRTTLMGGVPHDGSLSIIGLHVETPDATGNGNGASGRNNVFDIPVAGLASVTDASTEVATTTAHAQATYALSTADPKPGIQALERRGFKGLDARADYRMTFDVKGSAFHLDPLTVEADRLGRISLSADLGGVPYGLLARGRPASDEEAAFDQVVFKGFTVDIRNDGVAALVLPLLASSRNTSLPMLKAEAKTQSDLFIGHMLGTTPAAARLEAAIDAFIDDPQNLHIAVTAPAGLTGAEIKAAPDPQALVDRVGIEVAANR